MLLSFVFRSKNKSITTKLGPLDYITPRSIFLLLLFCCSAWKIWDKHTLQLNRKGILLGTNVFCCNFAMEFSYKIVTALQIEMMEGKLRTVYKCKKCCVSVLFSFMTTNWDGFKLQKCLHCASKFLVAILWGQWNDQMEC